jgi:hypothetical protein
VDDCAKTHKLGVVIVVCCGEVIPPHV